MSERKIEKHTEKKRWAEKQRERERKKRGTDKQTETGSVSSTKLWSPDNSV